MGFFMHHQRLFTYRQHFLWIVAVKGYNARFVHHYFVVMYNEGIGCTQVDGNFLCKPVKKSH